MNVDLDLENAINSVLAPDASDEQRGGRGHAVRARSSWAERDGR